MFVQDERAPMNQQQEKDVWDLVHTLTDKKQASLDSDALRSLKSTVKRTPAAAVLVWQLLREQLQHDHAQTRLLALEVCDVFFTRSQAFRGQLSQHFSSFMAATVGHQQDQPLPGPAAVAVTLRTKALAAIERWQQQWGQYYPQVTLGHRYLKHTLRLTFPDVSAALTRRAAQQAQQHARTQAWLQQQYATLLSDLPSLQQQVQGLAQQIDSGLALLRAAAQQQAPPAAPAAADGVGAGTSSADGQAGEASGGLQHPELHPQEGKTQPPQQLQQEAPKQQPQQQQQQQQQQSADEQSEDDDLDMEELLEGPPMGLAAYAVNETAPGVQQEEHAQEAETEPLQLPRDLPPEVLEGCEAVQELLQDVARQLNAVAQQVQRGLRVVSQVELSEAQAQERQQLLRQLVGLKQQVQEHLQAAGAASGPPTGDPFAADQAAEGAGNASATALDGADLTHTTPDSTPGMHRSTPAAAIELPWPVRGSIAAGPTSSSSGSAQQRRAPVLRAQLQPRGTVPPVRPLWPPATAAPGGVGPGTVGLQGGQGSNQQGLSGRQQQEEQQQQRKRKPPAPPVVSVAKAPSPYVIPLEVVRAAEEGRLTKRPHLGDSDPPQQRLIHPAPLKQPASSAQQQQVASSTPAGAAAGVNPRSSSAHTSSQPEVVPQVPPGATRTSSSSGGGGKSSKKSGLPEEVRQRLLAAAPLVEGVDGDQWVAARHALTSSRISCEVNNHWGRADPDVELPQHRVNELLGQMPMYYTVKHPQHGEASNQQQQAPVQQQHQQEGNQSPLKQEHQQQQGTETVQQQAGGSGTSHDPAPRPSADGNRREPGPAVVPRGTAVTRIGKPRPWQKPQPQQRPAPEVAAVAAAAGAAAAGAVAGVMAPPPPMQPQQPQQQQERQGGNSTGVPAPTRPAPGSAVNKQLRAAAEAAAAAVKRQASVAARRHGSGTSSRRGPAGESSSSKQQRKDDASSYNTAVLAMAAASTSEALAARLQQEEAAAGAAGAVGGGPGGARQRKQVATKSDLVRKKLLG